jgi:hypothetical protein
LRKEKSVSKNPRESHKKAKLKRHNFTFHYFRFCRFLMSIGKNNGPWRLRTSRFYSGSGAAFPRQILSKIIDNLFDSQDLLCHLPSRWGENEGKSFSDAIAFVDDAHLR